MPNINALTKNVRDLLDNKKYSIEYYQREYRWGEEQIVELLTDLEDKFFEDMRMVIKEIKLRVTHHIF